MSDSFAARNISARSREHKIGSTDRRPAVGALPVAKTSAMDDDFDSVSWQNEGNDDSSRPATATSNEPGEPVYGANSSGKRKAKHASGQAGSNADAVDLAGIGEGRLDCTVDTPIKEHDGTKDAYVSYLVTTRVRVRARSLQTSSSTRGIIVDIMTDRFCVVLKIYCQGPPTLHRLRLPIQIPLSRVPAMRSPTSPRQAQNGVCSR